MFDLDLADVTKAFESQLQPEHAEEQAKTSILAFIHKCAKPMTYDVCHSYYDDIVNDRAALATEAISQKRQKTRHTEATEKLAAAERAQPAPVLAEAIDQRVAQRERQKGKRKKNQNKRKANSNSKSKPKQQDRPNHHGGRQANDSSNQQVKESGGKQARFATDTPGQIEPQDHQQQTPTPILRNHTKGRGRGGGRGTNQGRGRGRGRGRGHA